MKSLKLILHQNDDIDEILQLPDSVNELFINNKKNNDGSTWVLNIGSILYNNSSEEFNFENLKTVWTILREKKDKNLIETIDIYVEETLMYSIANITDINYVIDFLGDSLGERIGIGFN